MSGVFPALPEDFGGVAACGASSCGEFHSWGLVGNLSVSEGALGTALVSFEHNTNGGMESACFVWWVFIDGAAAGTIQPGEIWESAPLGDGGHEVEIVQVLASFGAAPDFGGDLLGRRVRLEWSRSTAIDLDSYQVAWDEGDPMASVDTILATIDEIAIGEVTESGTPGDGAVAISGAWNGPVPINDTLTVEVTSTGWETSGAGLTTTGEIIEGVSQSIGNGLVVTWLSPRDDYSTGQQFNVEIGPSNRFISPEELPDETYRFAVRALDSAGNASAFSSAASITIDAPPDAPSGVSLAWDADESEVVFTFTAGAGAASHVLLTNYDTEFDVLRDFVMEDGPIAVASSPFELPIGDARGALFAYLRAVDSGGQVEQNATLLSVEITDEFPEDLPTPTIVSGRSGAGGTLIASYEFDQRDIAGDAIPTEFNLYISATGSIDDATLDVENEPLPEIGADEAFPIFAAHATTSVQTVAQYLSIALVLVTVTIVDDEPVETRTEGPRSPWFGPVTPDATAPSAPTITGVSIV